MFIQFVVRADGATKHGGDSAQIEAYASGLRQRGHKVVILPFRTDLKFERDSIVHLVNVDRVYDVLCAERVARSSGARIFVTPIHHDLRQVRRMRSCGQRTLVRRSLERILPESVREYLAFLIRSRRFENMGFFSLVGLLLSTCLFARSPWWRVGKLLARAERVFVLSESERDSLRRDTTWCDSNYDVIPNGVPERRIALLSGSWSDREKKVAIVGRVEPRKRILEAARIIGSSGIPVVVMGAEGGDGAYARAFENLVRGQPLVNWLGPVSSDEVVSQLSECRVLVNASFVEVQSLVDIEARMAGCWVINFSTGSSREWLGDGVVELREDSDVAEVVESITACFGSEPPVCSYNFTWDDAVAALSERYLGNALT